MSGSNTPDIFVGDIMKKKIYRLDFRVKDKLLIEAMDLRASRLNISRAKLMTRLLESEFVKEIEALQKLDYNLELVK